MLRPPHFSERRARRMLPESNPPRIAAARGVTEAMDPNSKTVAVCGATGRQGGAVARRLIERGWKVRALTRRPDSKKARVLAEGRAEVVRADMTDRRSLEAAFQGAYGVYSVQNPIGK
jgi:predicted amino acid dehydrogenase